MTATRTTTTETLSSPPPAPPRRGLLAIGLAVLAALALIPWLNTSSPTEASPIVPTSVAAAPQQAAPVASQASAGSNAVGVHRPTAYVLFCQNSLSLCAPVAPTPPSPGYVQFCWNSPTLCTVLRPN